MMTEIETELWKAYNHDRSLESRNALVENYMPAAYAKVQAFRRTFAHARSHEELVSFAYQAIIKAVETYNPSDGTQPLTWVCDCIYWKLRNTLQICNRDRLPVGEVFFEEKKPIEDKGVEQIDSADWVESVLSKIPDERRRGIVRDVMNGYTFREIARSMGVSCQRVRQLYYPTIEFLKDQKIYA